MDKRLHSRISVESQCKARFHVGGQNYNNVTVANLSADGACLKMPWQAANDLGHEAQLDNWELIHPSLPRGSIRAQVVWSRNLDRPKTDYVEAGVRFLDAPEAFTAGVDRYVTTLAKSNPPTFM